MTIRTSFVVQQKRDTMKITMNGEVRDLENETSVLQMLTSLELNPAKVAVERNLEIVPRSLFAETMVKEGDRIEIVRFIGGG
ncbi:MAG: sulfur carrier protein ThiS [Robiginitomaculum sp.]|nr:sulfur carrier protein ThiS [Robiginitomaculum sp.]